MDGLLVVFFLPDFAGALRRVAVIRAVDQWSDWTTHEPDGNWKVTVTLIVQFVNWIYTDTCFISEKLCFSKESETATWMMCFFIDLIFFLVHDTLIYSLKYPNCFILWLSSMCWIHIRYTWVVYTVSCRTNGVLGAFRWEWDISNLCVTAFFTLTHGFNVGYLLCTCHAWWFDYSSCFYTGWSKGWSLGNILIKTFLETFISLMLLLQLKNKYNMPVIRLHVVDVKALFSTV